MRLPECGGQSPSSSSAASAASKQEHVAFGTGNEGSCAIRRGIGNSVPLIPKLIDDDLCVAPTVMTGRGPATHVFWPTQTRKTWMAGPRPAMTVGSNESLSTSVGITRCSSVPASVDIGPLMPRWSGC
jgi:hypothetical protein